MKIDETTVQSIKNSFTPEKFDSLDYKIAVRSKSATKSLTLQIKHKSE